MLSIINLKGLNSKYSQKQGQVVSKILYLFSAGPPSYVLKGNQYPLLILLYVT